MKCPYDEQQCEYPNCIDPTLKGYFDSQCEHNYIEAAGGRVNELTACLIKPDAFPIFAAEIISRLLAEKFKIVLGGTVQMTSEDVDDFYHTHIDAPYYENLKTCMLAGPVFAMILERDEAIRRLRYIMGPTHIESRKSGELRYELGDPSNAARNVLHGSDTLINAHYEIRLLREWLRR